MSPVVQGVQGPDRQSWQWLHLEDFTAGVYDNTFISNADPVLTAPLGAATAAGTWCCAALPGGGLGPLPKRVRVSTYPTAFPSGVTALYIVGQAVTPELTTPDQEVVLMLEGDDGTTKHYFKAYSVITTLTVHTVNKFLTHTAAHHGRMWGCPFPFYTRARSATPTTKPGTPVLIFPSNYDASANGQLWAYPSPTARGTIGAKTIRGATSAPTGRAFGFANRIVTIGVTSYTWPRGSSLASAELINFTTPPNSYTYGKQTTVFAAEDPFGYGCVGSISTGELLMVKREGGGVVVNGDVFSPSSVLYLPGIQPTGSLYGKPAATNEGLFYCSEAQGAWLWNGGNVSVKVSRQLRDSFYDVGAAQLTTNNNIGFYAQRWGKLVVFSNNYVYTTTSQSWWVLYPNATSGDAKTPGRTYFWFNPGVRGFELWASPWKLTASHKDWLCIFTSLVPAPHYQWESLPIHVVQTANHVVDVREIVVRASVPTGSAAGALTVTVGSFSATVTVSPHVPTPYRLHVGTGALGLDDIRITLHGDNTTTGASPPIVHSIDVAYEQRAHVEAAN